MNPTARLWHLHVTEQEIEDKTKLAQHADDALANDPAVAAARAANDAALKQLADLRAALRDRELAAQSLDAKIKGLNAQLYGGRVSNPKELDGLEKDLHMHQRQRTALDDELLGLMDQVDHAQTQATATATALKTIEANRASDLTRLTRERDALTARLRILTAEREQTRAALSSEDLRQYERLRQTKAGRAIAQMRRDSCGACGVNLPTGLINRVHAGDEVTCCPSCGRILSG